MGEAPTGKEGRNKNRRRGEKDEGKRRAKVKDSIDFRSYAKILEHNQTSPSAKISGEEGICKSFKSCAKRHTKSAPPSRVIDVDSGNDISPASKRPKQDKESWNPDSLQQATQQEIEDNEDQQQEVDDNENPDQKDEHEQEDQDSKSDSPAKTKGKHKKKGKKKDKGKKTEKKGTKKGKKTMAKTKIKKKGKTPKQTTQTQIHEQEQQEEDSNIDNASVAGPSLTPTKTKTPDQPPSSPTDTANPRNPATAAVFPSLAKLMAADRMAKYPELQKVICLALVSAVFRK